MKKKKQTKLVYWTHSPRISYNPALFASIQLAIADQLPLIIVATISNRQSIATPLAKSLRAFESSLHENILFKIVETKKAS